MNRHILADKIVAFLGGMVADEKKFFSVKTESLSFKELISAIKISPPEDLSEKVYEVIAQTPAGDLKAAYKVEQWLGNEYATLIYHHGNLERPFDYHWYSKNSFYRIFIKSKAQFNCNLIVVRAPFHDTSLRNYRRKMTDLGNFMSMLAVSVKINEALVQNIKSRNEKNIITSGMSLGGWVTNLHRSFFNTSTYYIPVFSGAYLGDLFITSDYKKLTGRKALEQAALIRSQLNFHEEFCAVKDRNLHPLLGKYDQFVKFDIQSKSYREHAVSSISNGHITGSVNSTQIRNHILEILEK